MGDAAAPSGPGETRRPVLAGHRRVGKRFIPPLLQAMQLGEVRWVHDLLPEVLWMGLLNQHYGFARGAELALALGRAGGECLQARSDLQESFASYYADTTKASQDCIVDKLSAVGHLDNIRAGLRPLTTLYPSCPFNFLQVSEGPGVATANPDDLVALKALVANLIDRTSQAATFTQANVVYLAFVLDHLRVMEGLTLANFPAVEQYPSTEESKAVASAVRATVNSLGYPSVGSAWPRYFWNRGLELDSCELPEEIDGE